jgi:tetratricopeptide (TPR) repeat protein
MYRILFTAAALLVFVAVRPSAADDRSVCSDDSSASGDEKIAACSRVLTRTPKEAAAYHNIGFEYNNKGDYERAISALDQAIRLNPKYVEAYVNRGYAYNGKGEYDRAIADLDEAIRLNPKFASAYNNRGFAYDRKGDHDRAITDYDQAIRLDPKLVYAYVARGNAYNSKGDYDRAIADLDQAIKLQPNFAKSYSYRGYAYGRKGDFNRAMADLNRAIALDPISPKGYSNRAAAYELHGDVDHAIADADEAIRLDPKDAFAYNWRGNAWFDKASYDRAIADYDQAIRFDPTLTEARQGRERAQAAVASRVSPNPGLTPRPATITVAGAQPAKRALVIGIDAYANLGSAAQLERAVADAEAVGDKLMSLGFRVTRLTTARQTSLEGVIRGFEDFKKTIEKDDMVVLFYAGHGMGLSDGTYLVPADVREASLQVEATAKRVAVSENELTEGLQRAGAGIVVAVIDACRNDLFSRAVRRAMGNERGLRPIETEGMFKLYSASEGQTALDRLPGDSSQNSVFTRVFLKALGTPGLNLSALGTRVRDEVFRLTRSADHVQTPAVYDKLIGSTEVYFVAETAAADRRAQ